MKITKRRQASHVSWRRVWIVLCVLACMLGNAVAEAASVCVAATTPVSTVGLSGNSVFSVSTPSGAFQSYTASGVGGPCAVTWYNSSLWNAVGSASGNSFTAPTGCENATNSAAMKFSNNAATVPASYNGTYPTFPVVDQYLVFDGPNAPSNGAPSTPYQFSVANNFSQGASGEQSTTVSQSSTNTQSVTLYGRAYTVPMKGQPLTLPSDVYNNWGAVVADDGNEITINANPAGVHIASLSLVNCGGGNKGVTFMAGTYYIDQLSIDNGCSIKVSGGRVTLNMLAGLSISGTASLPSCVNWTGACGASATASVVAAQHPENLSIYAYNYTNPSSGSSGAGYYQEDNSYVSAGIYVMPTPTGQSQANAAQFLSSTRANQAGVAMSFVGEAIAPSFAYTNTTAVFAYMSSGMFSTGGTGGTSGGTTVSLRTGTYQLSSPAIAPSAKTGDYAYFGAQEDANSSGVAAYAGHLFASALSAAGTPSATPAWDAAAQMTLTARNAKLYTQGASGAPVLLANVQSNLSLLPAAIAAQMQPNGANAIGALLNPNYQSGAWLAGRSSASLMGRPLYSQPIIAGNAVIVGSEDGFLYAFNRATGALLWGFIPAELLPSTQVAGALINTNPWGQSSYASYNGVNYVMGTAMQGAVHVGLAVDANGNLATNSSGALSPVAWKDYEASQASPASPVGGAAPTMAVDQRGTAAGKVAYIYGTTFKRASIVDGSGATTTALSATPGAASSNVVYLSDSAAYYGTALGNVVGILGAVSPGSLGETVASPVLYMTGDYSGSVANAWTLIGASATKAQAFNPVTATASAASWQFSAASATGIPNLPANSTIASMPAIYGGLVYFGITTGTDPCTQVAYEVGPLSVLTGAPILAGGSFRAGSLSSAINALGAGAAFFAPGVQFNGRAFVMADANAGGSSNTLATGWGAYTQLSPDKGNQNYRNDWRELTSFIVGWMQRPWTLWGSHSSEEEFANDLLA